MRIFDKIIPAILSAFLLCLYSCGESNVEIGRNTYSPRIVIDGYLYPGHKVEKIKITRNIPLNSYVDPSSLVLQNAIVKLTEIQSGREYRLTFNPQKLYYEYNSAGLSIEYGKSYQLYVSAVIDGVSLSAASTTRVPNAGFGIIDDLSSAPSIVYRERNNEGEEKFISIAFSPSPGTAYYLFSIVALGASDSSFIYENPYMEVKRDDVVKELDRFKYQMRWLQNVNSEGALIRCDLEWFNFWFYGNYRIIAYACDENFRLYNQTYKNVQEFDGNFHEPRMNITGEGIGIFGSAISDTLYIKVTK